MSKLNLALVVVFGVVMASTAFADRAHVLVEGTGDAGVILGSFGSSGSFYTDDAYNMFYNPAYVNDYKNWAIIEKSNFSQATVANSATTPPGVPTAPSATATGSTAQGGFATSVGNFNLALFFNRQDDLLDTVYAGQGSMRPIDVIFGGDAGMAKWGLGVSYASYAANPTGSTTSATSNDVVVRAGLEWNDLEPFVNWRVMGTDNGTATGPSNKGLTAGVRYHWGEWVPYAAFRQDSYNSVKDYQAYGVGLGRVTKITDAVKLGYSVAYFRQAQSFNSTVGNANLANGSGTLGSRSVIPMNVSVEGDANSWLTLRAGLGYNFLDHVNGVTVADNTTGRLGATAHAGKVDFDMAVGHGVAGTGAEGSTDTNSQDFDFANGLFTAAALSYHW